MATSEDRMPTGWSGAADAPPDHRGPAIQAAVAAKDATGDGPVARLHAQLLGGALSRQPEAPNAVAGRDAAWGLFALAPGIPELARVAPGAVRGVLDALRPWAAPGCLVNFLGDVSGPEEVAAAYAPEIRERLREVKRAVDPSGVFTFGHAI